MTATLNVNLAPCDCASPHKYSGEYPHYAECAAEPVLIPCSIPPSVPMVVRLGECTAGCPAPGAARALNERGETHHAHCPARPVRVSCSISGNDWQSSEVAPDWDARGGYLPRAGSPDAVLATCRDLWAIVKALVLGRPFIPNHWGGPALVMDLFTQRDAVFAALADMARSESGIIQAAASLDKAYPRSQYVRATPRYRGPSQSQGELEIWVAHIIEQVGNL